MKTKVFYFLIAAGIGIAGCSATKSGTESSDTVGVESTDSTMMGTDTTFTDTTSAPADTTKTDTAAAR